MTFVHNNVSILGDMIDHPALSDQALHHRHVQPTGRIVLARAYHSDLLRFHPKEKRQLRNPLIEEGFSVNDHQGIPFPH